MRALKPRPLTRHILPLTALLLALLSLTPYASATPLSSVPFVGCPSSGLEEIGTPTGQPIRLKLPASVAAKLTIFVGQKLAILGPRGWKCIGSAGSSVRTLDVFPSPGNLGSGPAIILSVFDAEAPGGAYVIASYGSRYFPNIVSKKGIELINSTPPMAPSQQLHPFPYRPNDKLTYINTTTFQFQTPAFYPGLGPSLIPSPNWNYKGKNSIFPISGLIRLIEYGGGPYILETLAVALPYNISSLKTPILDFGKSCIIEDQVPRTNPFCDIQAIYPGPEN